MQGVYQKIELLRASSMRFITHLLQTTYDTDILKLNRINILTIRLVLIYENYGGVDYPSPRK